jgi:hypothetical protein
MRGLSQKVTIGEFQQVMASDAQKFPTFLRKIANVAKPVDMRMLKESKDGIVRPQTTWVGWR